MRPGEIYCLPCRRPTRPAGGIVEYSPSSPTAGTSVASVRPATGPIHRRVNRAKLSVVNGDLEVTLTAPAPRLLETYDLPVNCELESEEAA